jgi:UDP-N-acetyl-D-mannosaminuronic acid dehydrogenase
VATGPNERIRIVGGAGNVGLPTVDILDTNAEALKTIKATRRPICRAN